MDISESEPSEDTNYQNYIEQELNRIKAENPNMYFNRADLLDLMMIPRSSSSLIIIRWNKQGTGFKRDTYIKEYCEPYISEKEFKVIIDHCSFLMKKLYSK